MSKNYIQYKSSFGLETIDEFDTRREALKMLHEYQMAFSGSEGRVYLSTRPCRAWTEKKQKN